ncbi:MAG: HlyD family secretion protein [Acidobacteria bacterium]|nr:HlyD family secretion protein [Acidobacteriota bacterium]
MAKAKKWVSLGILLLLVVVGAAIGYARWRHNQIFVTTENAYVQGDVYMVSFKVPGKILEVNVTDNQPVKEGDAIAALDPHDYDLMISSAEATLAEAISGLATDEAMIAQYKAQVAAAKSQLDLADTELARVEALYKRESLPKQNYDRALAQQQVASAQLEAAKKAVAASQAKLVVSQAKVDGARARLESAKLQRSYCTVVAPVSGFISKKSGEAGQVVAAGQPICAVVPLGLKDIWVEANYKETQLKRVRPGQKARIWADIDKSRVYTGTVESLSAGTGGAFALLPPENATGNWVKIVQRLPVKIKINQESDPNHELRLGLTVTCEIDTTK